VSCKKEIAGAKFKLFVKLSRWIPLIDRRLAGHIAASFGATTARFGAVLTVIHVMRAALCRTPVADVRTQFTNLPGERTVAGDRIDTQPADRRALDAARRTFIFAILADHVRETVAALDHAVVACGDAVLGVRIQMMAHGVIPLVEIGR